MYRNLSVSVVVPTFNRAERLAKAIDSLLAQTRPPAEIIVVDDGSTDETSQVMCQLARDFQSVKYVQLPRNMGGSFARNVGIDAAGGDLVAFLDSDDEWLPNHLEVMAAYIGNLPCDEFVVSSRATVDALVYPEVKFKEGSSIRYQMSYMLRNYLAFQTSTIVLPRDLAARTRFDERLRRHQDWDFVARLARSGVSLRQSPVATCIYTREGGGKVSATSSSRPSLRFLAKHRAAMSARARLRFVCLEVRRRTHNGLIPIRELAAAFMFGGLSMREVRHFAKMAILNKYPRRENHANSKRKV